MESFKSVPTPLVQNLKLSQDDGVGKMDVSLYRMVRLPLPTTLLVPVTVRVCGSSSSAYRSSSSVVVVVVRWIYEHFPSVGFAVPAEDYDERRLCACRWTSGKALPVSTYRRCLDRLIPDVGGLYDSLATSRLFCHIFLCLRSWMKKLMIDGCSSPGDPPRVPLNQQYDTFVEPDVYQQSMAVATPNEADVDVHHVRHAVDGFVAITNKLERLLNLRILTKGTEVYTVVQECLGIARSYIGQPTVGHRSRHMRRTDGH
ncbi:uncharacterized protein LOC114371700 [Glycine soja]|uniref:uncharacterized protein LOC114371700 n=1 Tax=Glycine soja TaxID=3848 RepID=UPI00103E6DE1|nr:uncharacterized protein LOC114371700 [Glycine soja]